MACNNPVTSPEKINELPAIYPDYIGVTVPVGIAPMNFNYLGDYECLDVNVVGSKSGKIHLNDDKISFPDSEWKKLLQDNVGDSIVFTLSVQKRINGYNTDLFQCM